MKMIRCLFFVLLILLICSQTLKAGLGRPVFELPAVEGTFECTDTFFNRAGDAWLSYGYQCYKKSSTLTDTGNQIKYLTNALSCFQEAQKTTTNPLISSVSTFFEGLTFCRLINYVACESDSCQSISIDADDDIQKTRFCDYRRKMYNAFLNVDFEDMLIEGPNNDDNEVAGIIQAYEKCINDILGEDWDRFCYREKTTSIDYEALNTFIFNEINNEVVPLFKDVSSPYYALFNKKIEIANFFTDSAKDRIDSLYDEKSRLNGVLNLSENKYNQYFKMIDPLYKNYLALNINITKGYNRLMDLKASLLEEDLVMDLKEKDLAMGEKEQEIKTEITELQAINKEKKIEEIKTEGIRLCKIYYCHLRSLPTLRFKRLCESNANKNNPLCKKEIHYTENGEDKVIKIRDLCLEIAPELSRYWQNELTDETLIKECLKSF